MRVRFCSNLGSRDAAALDLDFSKCRTGDVAEVSKDTFETLRTKREGTGYGPGLVEETSAPVGPAPQPAKVEEPEPKAKK